MKLDLDILKKYLVALDLDKAREYRASCIPNFLSKFYSLTNDKELNEKKLSCLAEDCNWYENPTNQNDPFDARMGFFDEVYAKKTEMPQKTIDFLKWLLDHMIDHLLLCCFADSDYRNLPMWAYYANNYHGYCVNYKINCKENFSEVIYYKERTRLNEILSAFIDVYLLNQEWDDITTRQGIFADTMELFFSVKHKSWRHEKEYRIIRTLKEESDKQISNGEEKDQRIPNKEMGLEVKDITIGLKCKPEYKQRIMQIAKERNITCYQLCTDEKKFLSRQKINL